MARYKRNKQVVMALKMTSLSKLWVKALQKAPGRGALLEVSSWTLREIACIFPSPHCYQANG